MDDVELVGGHPALDLVNTVAWRGDPARRHDRLRTDADVLTWAARTEVVPAADVARLRPAAAEAGSAVVDALVQLREALHAVLVDAGDRAGPRTVVHRAVAAAIAAADLPERPPWSWQITRPELADLPAVAALQAADLLTSPDAAAVRPCADPVCGWLFVDRSRNRSRRWCSSADCGNRARARRHAQRARAGGRSPR